MRRLLFHLQILAGGVYAGEEVSKQTPVKRAHQPGLPSGNTKDVIGTRRTLRGHERNLQKA